MFFFLEAETTAQYCVSRRSAYLKKSVSSFVMAMSQESCAMVGF